MEAAAASGATEADELLVQEWRGAPEGQRAARRMAVARPDRLRAIDSDLDRAVRELLSADERLARARALVARGASMLAVRELEAERFRGATERTRRRTLAEARLAAGQPRGALRRLPPPGASDADELLVRATARRRLAWQRYPRPGTDREFARALASAERALAAQTTAPGRRAALSLVAEAAVEVRSLERAWWAWRELSALEDAPDEWLGRRLGVALAQAGDAERSRRLSVELPEHRRCLRYWSARAHDAHDVLRELAQAPVGDLYSRWSRQRLATPAPASLPSVPDIAAASPPASVQLLLEWGETELALVEWSRQVAVRGVTPAGALALADLRTSSGRQVAAIRALRAGFPDLGTVALDRVPEAVRKQYLPLLHVDAVVAASQRSGLDPWLVAGVARQESAFVPTARSSAGAVGLMQLMHGTARPLARSFGWGAFDLTDPRQNLRLGAAELARLLTRYDGALEPALAAYNAGPSRADRWWQRHPEATELAEAVPIRETYSYIRSVVYLAEAYRVVYADLWRRMAP